MPPTVRARVVDHYRLEPEFLGGVAISSDHSRLIIPQRGKRKLTVLDFRYGKLEEPKADSPSWAPFAAEFVPGDRQKFWVLDTDGNVHFYIWEAFPIQKELAASVTARLQQLGTRQEQVSALQVIGMRSFKSPRVALLIGAASDPVGGFVLPYDWSEKGQLSATAQVRMGLYEAPYDVDLWDGTLYIATGRGETVERWPLSKDKPPQAPLRSPALTFKPGRLRVSGLGKQVWVASYNELFWGPLDGETLEGPLEVTKREGYIGDLALSPDQAFIYATCPYSDEIRIVDAQTLGVSTVKAEGEPPLSHPLWLQSEGNYLFVQGHSNGLVWVLEVTR